MIDDNNDHKHLDFHSNLWGGGPKTKQSNFAAWEQSSEPEKKACGVLGVSRLKAHAGWSKLLVFILFWLSSSFDTSYINLSKTIKNEIMRLMGTNGGLSWIVSWLVAFVFYHCRLDWVLFRSRALQLISKQYQ